MESDPRENYREMLNAYERINNTQHEIVYTLERMSLKRENKLACIYLLGQLRQLQIDIDHERDKLKEPT